MTRTKAIIIGMLVLTLLAFGIVALAGGGFGRAAADRPAAGACLQERDSDGDGIPNCDDPDWTRPLDGTGYGHRGGSGYGQGDCLRDGSGGGQGMHRGYGQNTSAPRDGSCLE